MLLHERAFDPGTAKRGAARCYVRINERSFPTLWKVYAPKFADGMNISINHPSFVRFLQAERLPIDRRSCLVLVTLLHSDEVYVFDSLVLTVIAGDGKRNATFARSVYANDLKGRQAMTDAIYAASLPVKASSLYGRECADLTENLGCRQRPLDRTLESGAEQKRQRLNSFTRVQLGLPVACIVEYAGMAVFVEPLIPMK